ncbi:DsbE family thiol:disulfide interchange protein [Pelagibacteraceae bacterium]|nr:DsbE family thiol:disulfide interchange protein [Pelagibacteraceae bacterium]
MKKMVILMPLIVIFTICFFVLIYLLSDKDPNKPPSALLNKETPYFETVSLYDDKVILNNKSIKNKKVLINFFASWCAPCKIEHPLFFELEKTNADLFILGINHKDNKENALKYLNDDGNPYDFVGIDFDGLIALEFGVFGLPETFLINEDGKIIYKFMGPLTKEIIKNDIKPLL